ncbi:MAG: putative ion transporter superfamily protein YfcC [Arenicella sp.]|jgi:uncharacterized ion transporter superfamily protein YfcC
MEGHTWIYVVGILGYLYYLTKVFDELNVLMTEKSKILEPKTKKKAQREIWRKENSSFIRKVAKFKRKAILLFLIIPIVEVVVHFLLGDYGLTGKLMSAMFFVLFILVLFIILVSVRAKKSARIEKKYTWKSSMQL